MSLETFSAPARWRHAAWLARIALAVSCVSAAVVADGRLLSPGGLYALLFLLYSFLVPAFERSSGLKLSLFRLAADAVFFFGFITSPSTGFWLSSAFAAFVLLEAAVWHEWRETAMIAGLSLVLLQAVRPPAFAPLSGLVVACGASLAVVAWQRSVFARRMEELSRRATQSDAQAESARESERQRIAADFHDGPLQSFIGLHMRLEILRKMLERDPRAAGEELAQVQDLTRSQVSELRAFVRSMRALEPEGASLTGAIRRIVEDFRKHSGVSASLLGGESLGSAGSKVTTELLQVVREALHNAQKHSGASRVTVEASRNGDVLEILIEDDGSGFPFAGSYNLDELEALRIGPDSIKRRVRGVNGELNVDSRPGQGVKLRVRVPV